MITITAPTTASYTYTRFDPGTISGGWVRKEITGVDCVEPAACPVRDWLAAVEAFTSSDGLRTQLVRGQEPIAIWWKPLQLPPTTGETPASASPEQVSENSAVSSVERLRSWLHLSIDELAGLIGVSRSAVLYWKREDRLPRPAAARNLFRTYALIKSLRDSLGPDALLSTLMGTRNEAGLSAMDLLRQGRHADAEQLLRPLIFGHQQVQRRRLVAWQEEDIEPPSPSGDTSFRPPVRRARRVSLRK